MTEERIEVGADGYVAVPRGPGLGIHLNQRTIDKYRVF
jgi:L-alanine-DL-glutamate epimerase-like enolase superfamily enzyme